MLYAVKILRESSAGSLLKSTTPLVLDSNAYSSPFENINRWYAYGTARATRQMDEYFIVQSGMLSRVLFMSTQIYFCFVCAFALQNTPFGRWPTLRPTQKNKELVK